MGSHGIKDQVAIIGMGCTLHRALGQVARRPDHRRPSSPTPARITRTTSMRSGSAPRSPQPRVSPWAAAEPRQADHPCRELLHDRLRGDAGGGYAVASGAYDVVMALGAEKVKDGGHQGLNAFPIPTDGTQRTLGGRHVQPDPSGVRRSTASTKTRSATRSPRSPRRTTSTEPAIRWPSSAGRPAPSRSVKWPRSPDASRCSTAQASPMVPLR